MCHTFFYCLKKREILSCIDLPVQKEFIRTKDQSKMINGNKAVVACMLFLLSGAVLSGCSRIRLTSHSSALPILSQDELIRPYTKLGRIQVSREVFGSDYSLSSDIKAWGLAALQQEAEKMGADAIILPEVNGRSITSGIVPSTEYHATGFAIKFK